MREAKANTTSKKLKVVRLTKDKSQKVGITDFKLHSPPNKLRKNTVQTPNIIFPQDMDSNEKVPSQRH